MGYKKRIRHQTSHCLSESKHQTPFSGLGFPAFVAPVVSFLCHEVEWHRKDTEVVYGE